MEPRRLAQYTKLCRKLGIKKLVIGDVSIELDLGFEPQNKQSTSANSEQPVTPKDPQTDNITEEELLYWSTGPGGTEFPSN